MITKQKKTKQTFVYKNKTNFYLDFTIAHKKGNASTFWVEPL